MMNRRNFNKKTGKIILGSMLLPSTYPYITSNKNAAHAAILRSLIPVVRKFIESIFIKGIEEYASHKFADWLDNMLGFEKKKELEKIPIQINNSNVIISPEKINVYSCTIKEKTQVSLIPTLTHFNIDSPMQLFFKTHVSIFQQSQYLDTFNFPELIALNKLVQFYLKNENLGIHAAKLLRSRLLPISHNSRHPFYIDLEDRFVGSIVYKTKAGDVHILYTIDADLKTTGKISYYAKNTFDKIRSTEVPFFHNFRKENNYNN